MNLKTYTLDDLMRERPCFPPGYIIEMMSGRDRISPRDIAAFDKLSTHSRTWLLSRLLYRLSRSAHHRVARLISLDIVDVWPCPDIVYWYLITGDPSVKADAVIEAKIVASSGYEDASWYAARTIRRVASWIAYRDDIWNVVFDAELALDAWAWEVDAGTLASSFAWDASYRKSILERWLNLIVRAWEVHP